MRAYTLTLLRENKIFGCRLCSMLVYMGSSVVVDCIRRSNRGSYRQNNREFRRFLRLKVFSMSKNVEFFFGIELTEVTNSAEPRPQKSRSLKTVSRVSLFGQRTEWIVMSSYMQTPMSEIWLQIQIEFDIYWRVQAHLYIRDRIDSGRTWKFRFSSVQ